MNNEKLSLDDLCTAINTRKEIVIALVEYELLQPEGETIEEWSFSLTAVKRARLACSFYYELEINWQGVALALDLLDQIEQLEAELKYFKRS